MSQPTQTRYPWRATARTVVAVAVVLVPALPSIADELGVATYPVVAGGLAAVAAVTRVLAIPAVNRALHRSGVLSWLAAEPRPPYLTRVEDGRTIVYDSHSGDVVYRGPLEDPRG